MRASRAGCSPPSPAERDDRRQRRRRRRAAGPARSRPTSTRCSTRSPGASIPSRAGASRATRARRMAVVSELGGVDWFILGDRDIGLHLVRSERLRAGEPLSAITADFARRSACGAALLPATDDRLRTRIVTGDGELAFQEWLVGRRAADPVRAVRFEGVPGARPAPGVLEAIESADADRARALEPVRLARPDPRGRRPARRRRRPARARRRDHADDRRRRPSRGRWRGCSRRSGTRWARSAWRALLAPLARRLRARRAPTRRARPTSARSATAWPCVPALMRDARRAPPPSPAPRSAWRERPRGPRPARAAELRRRRRPRRPARWLPRSGSAAACATATSCASRRRRSRRSRAGASSWPPSSRRSARGRSRPTRPIRA